MTSKTQAIGIDLGTTYSCVALFRNGNVEILANEQGNRTTPSYVAFTDKERLIGQAAKDQAGTNPNNTIFDSKRLIGRKIYDDTVQEDMQNWPFQVIGKNGKPHIRVHYQENERVLPPEEVSSMILEKMKQIASAFHGTDIKKAVVTVPAYFNDSQRQATKDAATIAKLDILRIVNEPTAAGIAYGFRNKDIYKRNVLVFDFGGGTFDVSILTIKNGVYNVLATAGDTHLGGEDCDTNMVNHFVDEIKRKFKADLKDNKKAIYRLRVACEKAKRNLSTNNQASINVDSLFSNTDFNSTITRGKFENINAAVFEKLKSPILKALEDAELEKEQIDSIVLVGGSSRINLVNKLITELFPGKEINKNINPDEAVAFGAAILAAHLNDDKHESLKDFQLKDVTPLSLGMEVVGGQMEVIIERNTELPTSATKIFTTNSDNQTAVSIVVYEGERPLVKDNNKLGEFVINGIPRANREVPKIEVEFKISLNGIMQITADDKRSGASRAEMTIKNDKGRLSEPEIRRMIQDAAKFREDDEKEHARVRAKIELEDYCLHAESKISNAKGRITNKEKENVEKICQEYLEWLADYPDEDINAITEKFKTLQFKCDQTLAKC